MESSSNVYLRLPHSGSPPWNLRSTFALSLAGVLSALMVVLALFTEYSLDNA